MLMGHNVWQSDLLISACHLCWHANAIMFFFLGGGGGLKVAQ